MGIWGRAAVVAAIVAGISPAARAADVQFGPRVSISDDADFGVGADVRWTFLRDDPRLALVGSFDWFFPEDGDDELDEALEDFEDLLGGLELPFPFPEGFGESDVEYWEANLNLTWDFTTARPVIPYAGIGVNYGHARVSGFGFEEDEGEFGANVLAGVRIKQRFYVEAKQEAGGGELFVLTLGVRF